MRLIDVSEYNLKNCLIQWVEYGEQSISLHSKMLHEIPTVDAVPVDGLCDWMCKNLDIRVWCDDCMKRNDFSCDAKCPHMSREKLRKLLTELVEKTNE